MIEDLDTSLENMLKGEAVPGSELDQATISFAAPDKDWREKGASLELDIYLYRLLERRELRSNERHFPCHLFGHGHACQSVVRDRRDLRFRQ